MDASGRDKWAIIPAGRHEIERVPNPDGKINTPWLVLKGTLIGASEPFWRSLEGRECDDREVIIQE